MTYKNMNHDSHIYPGRIYHDVFLTHIESTAMVIHRGSFNICITSRNMSNMVRIRAINRLRLREKYEGVTQAASAASARTQTSTSRSGQLGLGISFGVGINYVSSMILNNPGVIKNLIGPIIGGLHDGEQE